MPKRIRTSDGIGAIVAVSGGADSVYLLDISRKSLRKTVVGHYNHGARGRASEADQRFVERLCNDWMLTLEVGNAPRKPPVVSPRVGSATAMPRFEEKARAARYAFLKDVRVRHGAATILVAHTADDQVETVLMRILEGAGISGLKGIPRHGEGEIERPLLDTWRGDILDYLRRHKISYRTDKSNFDTRFERNWIRHVLLPLLEKRYGQAIKRRIFALGERFREIDEFLGTTARRWIRQNVEDGPSRAGRSLRLPRKAYRKLPSAVRKKILQTLCFEEMEVVPNERLLETMDTVVVCGGPSARLNIGKGASLSCRYDEAVLRARTAEGPSAMRGAVPGKLVVRELEGKPGPGRLRRLAEGERKAVFDADAISGPLGVRPLRAGDRIRPLGVAGVKKVKDVLIDRKVARDERWGRPVVTDARGEIVWSPGVVRSAIAPVTGETRRAVLVAVPRPTETSGDVPGAGV